MRENLRIRGRVGNVPCAATMSLMALVLSCSSNVENDESVSTKTNRLDPPERFTDPKGNIWVRVGRVTDWSTETEVPERIDSPKENIHELSDEEFAEHLRPIALIGGWEYETLEAPLQLAIDIKSGAAERYEGMGEPDTRGLPVVDREEEGVPLDGSPAIIGGDLRALRRDNTTWPMSTHIQLAPFRCSATLIGRSTATSVAHCFMDTSENISGKWRPPATWAPGVDSQDANPTPFGSWNGCYIVVIRKGFKSPPGKFTYDYAVLEFSDFYPQTCNLYPGDSTGWLGWFNWSPGTIEDGRPGYVYGYPGEKPNWPQIWGIGCKGSGCFDVDGTDEIEYTVIDTTKGQSGSGFYQKSSVGDRYVTGSHQGSTTPWLGGVRNRARRIDGSYVDLIKNYTAK